MFRLRAIAFSGLQLAKLRRAATFLCRVFGVEHVPIFDPELRFQVEEQ